MAHRTVTVPIVTELLHHDHGHWCRRCALSTGIRAWVVLRFHNGVMNMQVRLWCGECGSRDIVPDPDPRSCS